MRSSTAPWTGLGLALASSAAFGTSGALIKPLMVSGWSPGAAVLARLVVGATLLLVPVVVSLRGRFAPLWQARRLVVGFGLTAVAGTQLAYFAAVERIPVSVALLLEYLAPVLLVGLAWARTRRTPPRLVLIGTGLAVLGLVLVIGPSGMGTVDLLGVAFGLLAAVGLASYFLLAAAADDLPPVALTGAGLVVGAVVLALAGLLGVLPMHANGGSVVLVDATVPWWLPLTVVGVVGTAFAYVTGIAGTTRLGSRVASFVGLSEVLFAALLAWVLLGEALGAGQLLGAAALLAGITLVRVREDAPAALDEPALVDGLAR